MGALDDARIAKEELQEDGVLYLSFDGTWDCEIEVWFWIPSEPEQDDTGLYKRRWQEVEEQ